MAIFSWIGSVFGYLLNFFFQFSQNYAVAIVLFVIAIKLITFPLSIKQQKSMAKNARMAGKQKELQKKCGNDKQKYQEELQKLYQKEGVSPMGGCLPMILPLIILMGVFYAVAYPLQNTLHIGADKVQQASAMITQIPGIALGGTNSFYSELDLLSHFDKLQGPLSAVFAPGDMAMIAPLSKGFHLFGLNLLETPSTAGFASLLWIIPLLSLITTLVQQMVTTRMQGNAAQMQGCMKVMMYGMVLLSVYISYTVPAAVGFYYVLSSLFGFVQTIVLHKFYNADILNTKEEGARIALRRQEEEKVKQISWLDPSKKVSLAAEAAAGNGGSGHAKKPSGSKKKKNNSRKSSSSDYLGRK